MGHDDPSRARTVPPKAAARELHDASIHVWWLAYRREDGRAPLRRVLAAYLDVRPEIIGLRQNGHGRPVLDGTLAGRLDFNWSHSGTRAVIAVARSLPVLGVDIEHVRPGRSFMALAKRFYAPGEYAQLASLRDDEQPQAFIRLWTAKEALLKAHGRGLSHGLHKVAFVCDEDRLTLAHVDGNLGTPASWQLAHWALPEAFFATLCWQAGPRQVRHFALASNA